MRAALVSILCWATASAETAPPVPLTEEALRWRLSSLLADPTLVGVQIGALVADVKTGRVLFAHHEALPLDPASNVKLATTAAALALLGPEYRFRTAFYGRREGEHVQGDLYVRGLGDPSLVTESLHALAIDLRAAGVREVEGGLVVDDGFFSPPPRDDRSADADAGYRAPPAALSLNYNTVRVVIRPAAAGGSSAEVSVVPDSAYFKIMGSVRTAARGAARVDLHAVAAGEQTELRFSGRVPAGGETVELRRRVAHPALYAGHTVLRVLAEHDVRVAHPTVRAGERPADLPVLASHESDPLSVLIRDVNKFSSNLMADQLLMAIGAERKGAPGTFASGIEAVAEYLRGLGMPERGFHLASGSGLDSETRLDAVTLVALLRAAARDFRYAADFTASLAVAGADGTLAKRMAGSPAERYVRAKTGTLQGVIALSGYAAGARREPLCFSILMNGVPDGVDARATVDEFASALAAFQSR
jgi:serine-type D-Ala-D-Ala carboxypeptidase/endopeptidase (penicillin-binding protein 4)